MVGLDEKDCPALCDYLRKMEILQLKNLGGELGLDVYKVEKMQSLPADMVRAWLRKEDSVQEKCGNPLTWNVLVKALQKIGQTGIATDILRDKCGQGQTSTCIHV